MQNLKVRVFEKYLVTLLTHPGDPNLDIMHRHDSIRVPWNSEGIKGKYPHPPAQLVPSTVLQFLCNWMYNFKFCH